MLGKCSRCMPAVAGATASVNPYALSDLTVARERVKRKLPSARTGVLIMIWLQRSTKAARRCASASATFATLPVMLIAVEAILDSPLAGEPVAIEVSGPLESKHVLCQNAARQVNRASGENLALAVADGVVILFLIPFHFAVHVREGTAVGAMASASYQRALYLRLFSAILGGRSRATQWKSLKHPVGITGR